jgi:GT2 family glycosyltransferase
MTDESAQNLRPAVSVIVPFGGPGAARAGLASVAALELEPGDELIIVDNSDGESHPAAAEPGLTVLRARELRSSYYARNFGAEHATTAWLLFIDADCRPESGLLDSYFATPPSDRAAVIGGEILGEDSQDAPAARWTRSRRGRRTTRELALGPHPAAATGNMLVRRAAFDEVGGFHEGVRSSADVELCWRLQDRGWQLEYRPSALVHHRDPERIGELARQAARYGAGRRWIAHRHPRARPHTKDLVPPLTRSLAGVAWWTLTGRFERARFKLLDLLWSVSFWSGRLALTNSAAAAAEADARPALIAISLDAPLEERQLEALSSLRASCDALRLEAAARPLRARHLISREVPARMLEDDAPAERLRSLGWLLARHPIRSLRDTLPSRGQGESRPPLRQLAPALRRIAAAGAGEIVSLGGEGEPRELERIARLTGRHPAQRTSVRCRADPRREV